MSNGTAPPAKKLWLVEIHEDDFEYDCFVSGVVWADTPGEARDLIRRNVTGLPPGAEKRLTVRPARKTGIVHEHWHAG